MGKSKQDLRAPGTLLGNRSQLLPQHDRLIGGAIQLSSRNPPE